MVPPLYLRSAMTVFFLFLSSSAAPREIVAVVDSLVGKAEVQRSGQQWRPVAVRAKLRNNETVRALDKSFLRISWPDGNVSFVHANSHVLLNFFESSDPDIVSTHLTVLYGAMFFVIKEIMPKALFKTYDTKIYTPTAVVSVRGTGFGVGVDAKNGSTSIQVIHGTLLVRNIIKDVSSFISAGFKTTVEMKTDPIVPKTLLDQDINDLKTWVPADVIESEMAAQLVQAKRDHDVLAADFKDKFVIVPFANTSKYKGPWNIGQAFAMQLAEQLKQSNKDAAVADNAPSSADPLMLGGTHKAKYVVTGGIEDFDIAQHAEITVAADEYEEFYIATVRVRVQLISVADKKRVLDKTFTGEARGKNLRENSWQKIGKLALDFKDPRFSSSVLGASSQQALDQAAENIIRFVNAE